MLRLALTALVLVSIHALGQDEGAPQRPRTVVPCENQMPASIPFEEIVRKYGGQWKQAREDIPKYNFSFARLIYDTGPIDGYNFEKSYWHVDYPNADKCILETAKLMTNIRVNPLPVVIRADDKILDHLPFAFITEAGWVKFSESEKKNLGNWLRKGGFLLVDDFHGPLNASEDTRKPKEGDDPEKWKEFLERPNEWRQWVSQLKGMIPEIIETRETWSPRTLELYRGEYVILRLPVEHPVFSQVFSTKEIPHVKGTRPQQQEWEEGSSQHYIMGLFNPKGVMISLMNYNMDIGDGWEYCREMFKTGYGTDQVPAGLRLGINYVMYSLTH